MSNTSNTTPATPTAPTETAASKTTRSPASKPKSASTKPSKAPKKTTKSKAKAPAKTEAKAEPKAKVKTKAKAQTKAQTKAPATERTASKAPKVKKPKLVRDSFTMPKDEYAAIQTLKTRSLALGQPAKKSELLRAGIKLLADLSDKALLTALKAVPTLKTGRPAKS